VAALVAAATFSHPDLDKVISAGRIALITKDVDGRKISEALTRREFVCTLFGYLSFSAFIISVLSAYLIGISSASTTMLTHLPIVGIVFTKQYFLWVRLPMIGGMSLLVAHLVTATALGIYYLMDRLYRYDRKIVTPKSGTSGDASAAA
jgi:type IV secretory pathway VirB6-like protein